MDSKNRALLWEELRVGGPIVAVSALGGLLVNSALRFSPGGMATNWRVGEPDPLVLAITLGVPVMAALLLTLNTANSGHLVGGFSRRILRLPVNTWSTVLIILMTRLALVLLLGVFTVGACWLLFGTGPSAQAILLVAGVYLLVQVLDWMRGWTQLPALFLALLVLVAFFIRRSDLVTWVQSQYFNVGGNLALTAFLLLSVAAAYGASLFFVGMTRRGAKPLTISNPFENAFAKSTGKRRGPFSSPMAAQIWFELRRTSLALPAMVLVVWAMQIGVGMLMHHSTAVRPGANRSWGLDTLWVFEILPLIALVLASFGWSLWAGFARTDGGRPGGFLRRLPLPKSQVAKGRLIAAGITLSLTWAVIFTIYTLSFLFANDGLIGRMISQSLSRGETNLRETLAYIAGLPLLAGLLAWIVMNMVQRPIPRKNVVTFFVAGVLVFAALTCLHHWDRTTFSLLARLLVFLVLAIPSLLLVRKMTAAWRHGLISGSAIGVCLLAWMILTWLLFPFSAVRFNNHVGVLLLVSLMTGALAVLPYFDMTLVLGNRGPTEPISEENPTQLRSVRGRHRKALGCLAVVCVAALGWLRWPADPAYKVLWRSQGLPTNLSEFDAWYAAVPPEQNLANLYLAADTKRRELERSSHYREPVKFDPKILHRLGGLDHAAGSSWIEGGVLFVGGAELERTELIDAVIWERTRWYWENVGKDVCLDLHAAARSGLTASRYPIDLRKGQRTELPHIEQVRKLSKILKLDALVAAVERQPGRIADDVLDILPIGHSLKDEPILSSQFVRSTVYRIAVESLETAMNRAILSDGDLKRLEEGLAGALPPMSEGSLLDRAMIGETLRAVVMDECLYSGNMLALGYGPCYPRGSLLPSIVTPALNVVHQDWFDRLFRFEHHAEMEAWAHTALRNYVVGPSWRHPWKSSGSHIPARATFAAAWVPGLDYAYEAEWRTRTRLDLARAAVAVERHRLAQGRLPQRIDDLVPMYLDSVPRDFWNHGSPVSYRIKDNGEFVVYSYGPSRVDHGGEISDLKETKFKGGTRLSYSHADENITFTVAPPDVRERPQIVPAPLDHHE